MMGANTAHWLANGIVVVAAVPLGLVIRRVVFRKFRQEDE